MLEHVSYRQAGRPHGYDCCGESSVGVRCLGTKLTRKTQMPKVIVKIISARVGVDRLIGDNMGARIYHLACQWVTIRDEFGWAITLECRPHGVNLTVRDLAICCKGQFLKLKFCGRGYHDLSS
jgi:hypothetical protein